MISLQYKLVNQLSLGEKIRYQRFYCDMQTIENLTEITYDENELKIKNKERASKCGTEIKLVEIGWKHRFSVLEDYKLQKRPKGGTKKLQLDTSIDYSVDEIINLGISKFNSSTAINLLKQSRIELGFHNDTTITNFSLSKDTHCGIWNYYKHHNGSTNRIHLYLLSTSLEENFIGCTNQESVKNKTNFKTKLQCNDNINNKVKQDGTNSLILNEPISHTVEINSVKNDFSIVQILYSSIKTSKYSGELIISETDKSGMYWKLLDEEVGVECEIQDFDPNNYACEISKIIRNGVTLYEISIDENLQKTYKFPNSYKEQFSHTILYDIDEIVGFSYGKFGIGIITTCTDECKPIFSWYLNDILFKEGQQLIWLNNIPLLDTENIWHCKVKCNEKLSVSRTVKINNNEFTSIELKEKIVPQIKKRDLIISSFHSQETHTSSKRNIYKGYYLGVDVTIRTMKINSMIKKNLQKEANILRTIEHANFISLMGICKGLKQFYIVTEYFEGKTLKDVIFSKETKNVYVLNEHKKKLISMQISKAITFLHLQKIPIVFRHLNTNNILINNIGHVKIYDISYCTFLMTNVINRYKLMETFWHIAPEILINNQEASIQSDVWSLACTLTELYREKTVWDIKSQEELKQKLWNREIPNLSELPQYLCLTLSKCFSYDINDRPSARDILKNCLD